MKLVTKTFASLGLVAAATLVIPPAAAFAMAGGSSATTMSGAASPNGVTSPSAMTSPSGQTASPATSSSSDTGPEALTPRLIRQAQLTLDGDGIHVAIDGVMGPQTRAALRTYQRQAHLQVTGDLDDATLAHMHLPS
jgi:peptidoglycan hydrolase-like protein with peptidoglycan-binding domain